MPTNKQKRDAARRHLERQLKRRAERDQARRRFAIIGSVLGTIILVVVIVAAVVLIGHKDKKKTTAANTTASSAAATDTASASPSATPSTSYPAATGAAVSFDAVTVAGATDLKGYPAVTSKGSTDPTKLMYKDLVEGTGQAPTATDTVTVQYVGVLYKGGTTPFDSSWSRGEPASFSLSGVVKGFTEGIAGTDGVPAMKVGGRRLIIMPAALGYGDQSPSSEIPANSPLVFVIDLVKVG